jgi:hypothetical protein
MSDWKNRLITYANIAVNCISGALVPTVRRSGPNGNYRVLSKEMPPSNEGGISFKTTYDSYDSL